ncbi:hypothetical protein SORBI_3001G527550 [Sorghum bicolor]|uniref:Uncharacterized protein n=1 Tax=Sorghum bicolor TaxID=4558 RepID=A0A1Z5SBR5_SORBI|nr:hypothetical protein SORBI_3001G527550 [Sorghum bicolor]
MSQVQEAGEDGEDQWDIGEYGKISAQSWVEQCNDVSTISDSEVSMEHGDQSHQANVKF